MVVVQKLYEIEGVACGSCQVCVLGNASLSKKLSEYFPDWKPGRVTQITLMGGIGQTSVMVECSYSPVRKVCSKKIQVHGDEEDLILERIVSLLEELSESRREREDAQGTTRR